MRAACQSRPRGGCRVRLEPDHLAELTELLATKRGLTAALHSSDPAFDSLPTYIWRRLEPALESLLVPARPTGAVRTDESAKDILRAVAHLSVPVSGEGVAHSLGLISIFTGGTARRRTTPAMKASARAARRYSSRTSWLFGLDDGCVSRS